MSRKQKPYIVVLLVVAILGGSIAYAARKTVAVLQPGGTIAQQEKNLMLFALMLSLVVLVPVFIMLFGFAWRYREGNKKADYRPDFDGSRLFESIWWGVPLILIIILGTVTWNSSRNLDPFRPLNNKNQPITIQVVALQWKWLFIYPKEGIAAVNYAQLPVNTPVRFEITSDAPMNSFWIPQLGGQIYAMSGMQTALNLEADKIGDYSGVSANISGDGFAGMHFTARASSGADYLKWVSSVKNQSSRLSLTNYNNLAQPNLSQVRYFGRVTPGLFNGVVGKYLAPTLFNHAEAGK